MGTIIALVIGTWIFASIVRAKDNARKRKAMERMAALEREQKEQAKQLKKHEAMLEKHEAEIRKLNFRMEKAEDEIVRFSEQLDALVEKKEEAEEEIESIVKALSATSNMAEVASRKSTGYMDGDWRSASGYNKDILDFMGAKQELDEAKGEKQKALNEAKLIKRKEVLEDKVFKYNNQIFSTEQRIKKAEFDRYEAWAKLEEVA